MKFARIAREFKSQVCRIWHAHRLNKLDRMDQFYAYARVVGHKDFFYYAERSAKKKSEFLSLVNALGIRLEGAKFIDIGPGYGDSLDLCHQHLAHTIDFLDNDPFFFHYNRLKRFGRAFYRSCVRSLHMVPEKEYNFIWLKGSVNLEYFLHSGLQGLMRGSLADWLVDLEKRAASECHIVITPLWSNDGNTRRIENVANNPFTCIMLRSGYNILPPIDNFAGELGYPIAFHKQTGKMTAGRGEL